MQEIETQFMYNFLLPKQKTTKMVVEWPQEWLDAAAEMLLLFIPYHLLHPATYTYAHLNSSWHVRLVVHYIKPKPLSSSKVRAYNVKAIQQGVVRIKSEKVVSIG